MRVEKAGMDVQSCSTPRWRIVARENIGWLTPECEQFYAKVANLTFSTDNVRICQYADAFEIDDMRDSMRYVVPADWLVFSPEGHQFPNTGAQRSWCNCCGAVGLFNWHTGKYE